MARTIEPHSPITVAVATIGLASFMLWGFLFLFIVSAQQGAATAVFADRLVFSVGYVAILLFAAFFAHVVVPLKAEQNLPFLVLAIVGIIGAGFANLAPGVTLHLEIIGALVAGLEYGWQLVYWSELFGYVKSRCAAFCFACSFVVVAVGCPLLFQLPYVAQVVITCILAVASPCCFAVGARIITGLDTYKSSERRIKKVKMREMRPRPPWVASEVFAIIKQPLLTAMLYSFIFSMVDIEYGQLGFWALGFGLLGIYLLVVIHFFSHRDVVRFTYRVSLLGMALGLIVLPYNTQVGDIFVAFAYCTALVLIIITLCEIAYRFETSVVGLSGFTFGGALMASVVGKLVGALVIGQLAHYDPITTLLASIALAMLVAYMVFGRADGGFVFEFTLDDTPSGDSNEAAPFDDEARRRDPHDVEVSRAILQEAVNRRCELVAAQFGLTNREREVLEHIMHGDSIQEAAEALYISPGTVKTHINHIYKKTGVDTRNELKKLVNSAR